MLIAQRQLQKLAWLHKEIIFILRHDMKMHNFLTSHWAHCKKFYNNSQMMEKRELCALQWKLFPHWFNSLLSKKDFNIDLFFLKFLVWFFNLELSSEMKNGSWTRKRKLYAQIVPHTHSWKYFITTSYFCMFFTIENDPITILYCCMGIQTCNVAT